MKCVDCLQEFVNRLICLEEAARKLHNTQCELLMELGKLVEHAKSQGLYGGGDGRSSKQTTTVCRDASHTVPRDCSLGLQIQIRTRPTLSRVSYWTSAQSA